MSTWEIEDADNPVTGWSSLDEMVWEEFGETDDHIVPGVTGEGWTSGADRRKRVHRDQPPQGALKTEKTGITQKVVEAGGTVIRGGKAELLLDSEGDSGEEPVADISLAESPSEDEEVPSLPEEFAAVGVSPPPSVGGGALLPPARELQAESSGLSNGMSKAETDLGEMGVYITGNQMFEEEDPAVVSTSCHFSLTDVGPAEGDVEFFEGDDGDGNRGNFLAYGWDNINHDEEMDKLFRSGVPSGSEDNGNRSFNLAAETQQWLVTSASQSLPGTSPPDGRSGMVKIEQGDLATAADAVLEESLQEDSSGQGLNTKEQQEDTLQHQQEQERKELLQKHQEEQRMLQLQHQQQQQDQMKKQEQRLQVEQCKLQQVEAEVQAVSSVITAPKLNSQPSSDAEGMSMDEDGLSLLASGDTKRTSSAQTQSTSRTSKKRNGRTASTRRLTSPISSPTVSSQSLQHSASMSSGPASPAPSLSLREPAPPPPPQQPCFSMPIQRHGQRPYLHSGFMPPMHRMPHPTGNSLAPLQQSQTPQQAQLQQPHEMQMQQPGMMAPVQALYGSQPLYRHPQGLQHMPSQMMPPPPSMQPTPMQQRQQQQQQSMAAQLQPPMPHMQPHLQGPGAVPDPMGFAPGHLMAQLINPPPQAASPMTPQEKIEKLKWRQQMRLAAEQRQHMHAQQVAEQQQQLAAQQHVLGAERHDRVALLSSGSVPADPAEPSQPTTGSSRGTAEGGAVEEGESVEASVLHQLESTMNKLDIGTRLCIRDALYRLARSSMQRKAASETSRAAGGDSQQQSGPSEQDSPGTSGAPNSPRLSSILETETNPIDRNIANLLFHRSGSAALFNSSTPVLAPGPQQHFFRGPTASAGPIPGRPQQGVMLQGIVGQGPSQGSWVWQAGSIPRGTWPNAVSLQPNGGMPVGAAAVGRGPLSMVQMMATPQASPMMVNSKRQFMPGVGMAMSAGGAMAMPTSGAAAIPPGSCMAMPPGGLTKIGGHRLAPLLGISPPPGLTCLPSRSIGMAVNASSNCATPGVLSGMQESGNEVASTLPGYRPLASRSATSIPQIRPPLLPASMPPLNLATSIPVTAAASGVGQGMQVGNNAHTDSSKLGKMLPVSHRKGDAPLVGTEIGQQGAGGNNGRVKEEVEDLAEGKMSLAEGAQCGGEGEGTAEAAGVAECVTDAQEDMSAVNRASERGLLQATGAGSKSSLAVDVVVNVEAVESKDGMKATVRKGRTVTKCKTSKGSPNPLPFSRTKGGGKIST